MAGCVGCRQTLIEELQRTSQNVAPFYARCYTRCLVHLPFPLKTLSPLLSEPLLTHSVVTLCVGGEFPFLSYLLKF